ncbi:MAG: ParA family protein, partial [Acidobacteria bacterium]|nr:ParA family protein [Acidobacteriota bacterium]
WVDAPPTASELAAHLFWAADILLVPLIPTPLSIRAYETISLWLQKKKGSLRSVRPFFNLVDMRKSLHRRLVSEYRMDHPEFLETLIPQAAAVEKMGEECQPLLMFAPSHPAAHQYQALFRELAVAQQVDL